MNDFVFLYRGGMSEGTPSAEAMQEIMTRWRDWFAKLGEEGRLKDWGAPLQREGKRVAAGGIITDGPFAEGKEIIGGYSIIQAKDLQEAAELARGCPTFDTGGHVEVRPIAAM